MSLQYQKYRSWIDIIKTDGVNLSKWEEDFVESLSDQLERKKNKDEPLSERQAEILERIYTERTP